MCIGIFAEVDNCEDSQIVLINFSILTIIYGFIKIACVLVRIQIKCILESSS
jgi:hypothetical protein